jgi:hypothetical protein
LASCPGRRSKLKVRLAEGALYCTCDEYGEPSGTRTQSAAVYALYAMVTLSEGETEMAQVIGMMDALAHPRYF